MHVYVLQANYAKPEAVSFVIVLSCECGWLIYFFTVNRVSQTFSKTWLVALTRSSMLKMAEGHNTAISAGSELRNRLFTIRHGEVRNTLYITGSDATVTWL